MQELLIGAVADDVTGATDLALMCAKNGMPAVQLNGLPAAGAETGGAAAVVVALKIRTAPVEQAVAQALSACDWLRGRGARQIFFKVCSTFDSMPEGHIGPVAAALMERLGARFTVYCPAFPENGRTVYQGHLFVGADLLSESSLRDHPLTPMTDARLPRLLGRQLKDPQAVGLVPWPVVDRGAEALRPELERLAAAGRRHIVVDALSDRDLRAIGAACDGLPLVTGAAGLAMGLPENFRRRGLLTPAPGPAALPRAAGGIAVLAGSCAAATRRQVARMAARHAAFRISPQALAAGGLSAAEVIEWAQQRLAAGPVLIYSTAAPEEVAAAQAQLGRAAAGRLVEAFMAELARGLLRTGVRRFIVAGGETSGAVLAALGAAALAIGPEIAPGVPWTVTLDDPPLCLALKSGNFGGDDFFEKAWRMLP